MGNGGVQGGTCVQSQWEHILSVRAAQLEKASLGGDGRELWGA